MAGRLARTRPVLNTIGTAFSALVFTAILWLVFALVRWDFSPWPGDWNWFERLVLLAFFCLCYAIAYNIDPEDK